MPSDLTEGRSGYRTDREPCAKNRFVVGLFRGDQSRQCNGCDEFIETCFRMLADMPK